MATLLVTGGAGFFGGVLKRKLLANGHRCVSLDLVRDDDEHPNLVAIQGDLRDRSLLASLFEEHEFRGILHCAAVLAHSIDDEEFLWQSNVDGTRNLAELARDHGVKHFVFTSSNCLWSRDFPHPVTEEEPPCPTEIYGRSKVECERMLQEFSEHFTSVSFRCPTIIDSGRLGLLAILFEFIDEGRKVWLVGSGANRYQFINAHDLADACIKALDHDRTTVFNIGSDDVKTFREVYEHVIERAGTGARVANLPKGPTTWAMRVCHWLGISPLGPYQYKMIASNFVFDTSRIKSELGWQPTVTNEEMLWRAYEYYHDHLDDIRNATDVSPHKKPAKMGVIRLLKWLS